MMTNERRLRGVRALAPALLSFLALTALSGCTVEDPIDTVVEAAVGATPIDVGYGRTRYAEEICGRRCAAWTTEDTWGGSRWCYRWEPACGASANYVGLFEDAADVGTEHLFEEHPQDNYEGCGPKAAQNILRYYGLDITLEAIRRSMTTYEFPFTDQISTMPADLASGLQSLLNDYGDGDFTVRVHHDKSPDFVRGSLARGEPAIMLVYEGNHYVVATGFSGAGYSYHVIDYAGEARWETRRDLAMDFWHSIPGTSYQSGTVITIEHSNPVCECKPGERLTCGAADTGRQYCDSSCQWGVCTFPDDDQIPNAPTIMLEYQRCSASVNRYLATVAQTGVVSVTSFVKQYRVGTGAWRSLTSPTIAVGSRQSVHVRARACNRNGCSGYAYRSATSPRCGSRGGFNPL